MTAITYGWLNYRVDAPRLMWVLLFAYLPMDAFNGFLVQQLSIDLKLAQLYKTGLTFLGLYVLIIWKSKAALPLICGFGIMLIGPILRLMSMPTTTFFTIELPTVTRVLLLFTSICFAWEGFRRDYPLAMAWSKRTMVLGAVLVAVNVLLGYAGIGFYTYESTDVGFKGFFQAGNEVSAVFGLLSCYVLHQAWNKRGLVTYFLLSVLIMLIGVSIATKAAVLFAFLAASLTPVFNYREKLFSGKVIMLVIALVVAVVLLAIWLLEVFSELPFLQRVMYVFDTLGIWGVLLSRRDELVVIYFEALLHGNVIYEILFGSGSEALFLEKSRILVELDPIDITMYFGIPITVVFLILTFLSVYLPLKRIKDYYFAPCILLVNICFVFFAVIAGHIWTSGMLAGVWGIFLSMLNVKSEPKESQ